MISGTSTAITTSRVIALFLEPWAAFTSSAARLLTVAWKRATGPAIFALSLVYLLSNRMRRAVASLAPCERASSAALSLKPATAAGI